MLALCYAPDSYVATNTVVQLKDKEAGCITQFRAANASMTNAQYTAAYRDETTGVRKWIQQCIAPQGGTWNTGW